MENEKTLLKTGDKLYYSQYGAWQGFCVIDRVTDKYAFSGGWKFHKKIENNNTVKRVTSETWNISTFYVETPEVKYDYEMAIKCSHVRNYFKTTLENKDLIKDFGKEKLNEIFEIIIKSKKDEKNS